MVCAGIPAWSEKTFAARPVGAKRTTGRCNLRQTRTTPIPATLARSCIAAQHKSPVVARVGQKTPDLCHCFSLVGCEIVRELGSNALFEKCSYHHLFASALRKKEKLTEP